MLTSQRCREIPISLFGGAFLAALMRLQVVSQRAGGFASGTGGCYSGPGRLLLSVTAMPIFGNNQIDDPSCAGVTGRTCSLRIGVYLSGCLRDRVPLWGKGTSVQLPMGISGDWGEGLTHSSVGHPLTQSWDHQILRE